LFRFHAHNKVRRIRCGGLAPKACPTVTPVAMLAQEFSRRTGDILKEIMTMKTPMKVLTTTGAAMLLSLALSVGMSPASATGSSESKVLPTLHTNQQFIEETRQQSDMDITDIKQVLGFILDALPKKVKVYPTENYYYFSFYWHGYKYAGNLRLAARDRDEGKIHFAYFPAANVSSEDGEMHYKALTAEDGVKVSKKSDLVYEVSFAGKTTTFELNDLSSMKPPAGTVSADESFIGPMMDESGFKFYLIYNNKHKLFHYVLNETEPLPDLFEPMAETPRITIGRRSGFAFYQDRVMKRKILIGVNSTNVIMNNYYDGPFDQLPDNFLKGDELKNAVMASDKSTKGKIDKYLYFINGEGRYLISPYIQYEQPTDLLFFDECAASQGLPDSEYHRCLAVEGGGGEQ